MNKLEKINRSFGTWYEGLFGNSAEDVRPKDILRRIFAAMEDYRKDHFDNRVYVPNQYILEINVHDEDEKEYLLSFINRDELAAAIKRYCQQNHYHIRGALDVTIKQVEDDSLGDSSNGKKREKVRVRCCYSTKVGEAAPAGGMMPPGVPAMPVVTAGGYVLPQIPVEERTVADASAYGEPAEEEGTVPAVTSAALIVYAPDRPPFRFPLAKAAVTMGRSPRSGNDIVIESDGQISKRHARLEMDSDGAFTLHDLGSTNGTKVNGRRVESRILHDGDEITVGTTRLTFQQAAVRGQGPGADDEAAPDAESPAPYALPPTPEISFGPGTYGGAAAALRNDANGSVGGSSVAPPARVLRPRAARLVLTDAGQDVDDFLLASETLIGRGVTNDIVLPDRTIATRHARIVRSQNGYALEALSETERTRLNGHPVAPDELTALQDGDRIDLGGLTLRFEAGNG